MNNSVKIEYLVNNLIVPNNLGNELNNLKQKMNVNLTNLSNKSNEINASFNKLDEIFKKGPLYPEIQKNFQYYYDNNGINKEEVSELNKKINYEKFVEEFNKYKNLFFFKKLYSKYNEINKVKKDVEFLFERCDELEIMKNKYNYTKENISSFLICYSTGYQEYYKEWKNKNHKYVLKDYELKDLFADPKNLLPINKEFKLIGKDKYNLAFLLFLYQRDYFFKE